MGARAAVVTFVSLVALVLGPAAGARIVPQRGIGGAELGMTRADVVRALGKPRRVRTDRSSGKIDVHFVYPTVFVSFYGGKRVTTMLTTSRRERTAGGVGVGSTIDEVDDRVPGVRCVREPSGRPYCWVGGFNYGARLTWFAFKDGRVTNVGVTRIQR